MLPRVVAAFTILLALLFTGFSTASGQTFYVRAGAAGAGSGTDWQNAYPSLPSLLVRGATYYVADGSYPDYTFNTPSVGSTVTTIKKATVADHGTNSGWSSTFGDGQAAFSSFTFQTANWMVDGVTRNENDWRDRAAYGFRATTVYANSTSGSTASNVTVRYTDVGYPTGTGCVSGSAGFYVAFGGLNNWTISRNHIGELNIPIHVAGVNDFLVEYNYIGPSWHKEAISGLETHRWIIRHNLFVDNMIFPPSQCQHGGDGGTADIGIRPFSTGVGNAIDGWQIYGNVFADTGAFCGQQVRSAGVMTINAWTGNDPATNTKVYNNSFYNICGSFGGIIKTQGGASNVAYNNLVYKIPSSTTSFGVIGFGVVGSFWCYDDAGGGSSCADLSGSVISGSENPFVNPGALDFRLKSSFSGNSPTRSGTTLGAGFNNVDRFGTIRGSGGGWAIGAYELTSGAANSSPSAPAGLALQ